MKFFLNDVGPETSGFLVKELLFLASNDEYYVELPEEEQDSFDILSRDIKDSLAKREPVLVLDRLHTYSSKYIRELCTKCGIPTKDNSGDNYPLHSLVGGLVKHYKNNGFFNQSLQNRR